MNWLQQLKTNAATAVSTALTEARSNVRKQDDDVDVKVSFRSDNVPSLGPQMSVAQHPWANVLLKYAVSDEIAEFVAEVCLF
jgi:hypothetical protein